LEAQGFTVSDSIVYQDNQSAILMEKNGRASSSKRTRHINIRYFFVTDRVANGEIKIEYCPTLEMLADDFTKPLQGAQFKTFRDRIMNTNPDDSARQDYRSVLNVAEGELMTDRGWTKVEKKTRSDALGRSMNINGSVKSAIHGLNTMKIDGCNRIGDREHGNMLDREQRKLEQRLNWEIEYID
jgi:hypothetical protein